MMIGVKSIELRLACKKNVSYILNAVHYSSLHYVIPAIAVRACKPERRNKDQT